MASDGLRISRKVSSSVILVSLHDHSVLYMGSIAHAIVHDFWPYGVMEEEDWQAEADCHTSHSQRPLRFCAACRMS